MSGSAVGTIVKEYFELSGDDGRRVHFSSPRAESRYHRAERGEIARRLEPLAAKIEAKVTTLRRGEPWSKLLVRWDEAAGAEPGVSLAEFEQTEYQGLLEETQSRGPYVYRTSFGHQTQSGYLTISVRFRFRGAVTAGALHQLEDALYDCRTPRTPDRRYVANKEGVQMYVTDCDEVAMPIDRIRTELAGLLESRQLWFRGHSLESSLFEAQLEGPELCLVRIELEMAGLHHWGRTRAALLEAVQKVIPAAREWSPGAGDDESWLITVTPPPG